MSTSEQGKTQGLRRILRRWVAPALLVALLAVAWALRSYHLNWDLGHYFHPDERQILMVASALSWPRDLASLLSSASPLNPRFFAYGSLPIYLLRAVSALAGHWGWTWATANNSVLLARLLSVLFDTMAVLATYLLGRKVFGRRLGLLAAFFVTFSVLHIQLAHFYTVDTVLTALILLAVSKAVDVARNGRRRDGVRLGVLLGMALATKVSVLPLGVVALVAWLAWAWPQETHHGDTENTEKKGLLSTLHSVLFTLDPRPALRTLWARGRAGFLLTFGLAALCFVLLQPYALIDAYTFGSRIVTEIGMAQGWWDFPYTRQYAGTWGFYYQIRQILLFAMGPALGLLGLVGLLWLCRRVWRQPARDVLVLLTWPVLYAVMQGNTYAKFIRYMLPLLPFLCLAGAAMWVTVWRHERAFRGLWLALLVVVMASTVFYAIAFLNVYRQPHPWLQATAWICENVPARSTILTEYWDDPLPIGGSAQLGGCPLTYTLLTMDFHTLDTGARLEELLDDIEASDYIVLSSQRLYGALPRSPQYFPLAIRYYQRLFAEHLGFRLVAAPAVFPQWAGVTLLDNPLAGLPLASPPLLAARRPPGLVLDLGQADESFTVYDHPQPLIFARVERLPREELESLIARNNTDSP